MVEFKFCFQKFKNQVFPKPIFIPIFPNFSATINYIYQKFKIKCIDVLKFYYYSYLKNDFLCSKPLLKVNFQNSYWNHIKEKVFSHKNLYCLIINNRCLKLLKIINYV